MSHAAMKLFAMARLLLECFVEYEDLPYVGSDPVVGFLSGARGGSTQEYVSLPTMGPIGLRRKGSHATSFAQNN